MSEESTTGSSAVPKIPLAAIGAAVAVALAGAIYAVNSRGGASEETQPKAKSSNMKRRVGLMTAIALIENDTTRKLVLATLKAMAKRA